VAAYKFYRLWITRRMVSSASYSGFMGVQELELRGEIGGPSLAWGAGGTAFSSGDNASYPVADAFNGSYESGAGHGWVANDLTLPAHIGYEFPEPVEIVEYSVGSYPSSSYTRDRSIVDWELQASNDGIEWINLHQQIHYVYWSATFTSSFNKVVMDLDPQMAWPQSTEAFKFWRILYFAPQTATTTGATSSSFCLMANLQDNVLTHTPAVAYWSSHPSWGNPEEPWRTHGLSNTVAAIIGDGPPPWELGVEFEDPVSIAFIRFRPGATTGPRTWVLQASNDSVRWFTIHERSSSQTADRVVIMVSGRAWEGFGPAVIRSAPLGFWRRCEYQGTVLKDYSGNGRHGERNDVGTVMYQHLHHGEGFPVPNRGNVWGTIPPLGGLAAWSVTFALDYSWLTNADRAYLHVWNADAEINRLQIGHNIAGNAGPGVTVMHTCGETGLQTSFQDPLSRSVVTPCRYFITCDGETIKMYRNESLIGSVAKAGNSLSIPDLGWRVNWQWASSQYSTDHLGEIAIWDRCLSEEELADLFAAHRIQVGEDDEDIAIHFDPNLITPNDNLMLTGFSGRTVPLYHPAQHDGLAPALLLAAGSSDQQMLLRSNARRKLVWNVQGLGASGEDRSEFYFNAPFTLEGWYWVLAAGDSPNAVFYGRITGSYWGPRMGLVWFDEWDAYVWYMYYGTGATEHTRIRWTGEGLALPREQWVHVAMTCDELFDVRLYINGVDQEPFKIVDIPMRSIVQGGTHTRYGDFNLSICRSPISGSAATTLTWHGFVDVFRIYRKVAWATNFTPPTEYPLRGGEEAGGGDAEADLDGSIRLIHKAARAVDGRMELIRFAQAQLDGRCQIRSTTDDPALDGRIYVENKAAVLLDGRMMVGSGDELALDGKLIVRSEMEATLDGRMTVSEVAQGLLDGRLIVRSSGAALLDGQVQVLDLGITFLDGRVLVKDRSQAQLDGRIAVFSDNRVTYLDGRMTITEGTEGLVTVELESSSPAAEMSGLAPAVIIAGLQPEARVQGQAPTATLTGAAPGIKITTQ
jgi:hypothetical protein